LGFETFFKQSSTLKPIKPGIEMTFKANLAAIAHSYTNTKPEKNLMLDTIKCQKSLKVSERIILIVLAKPDEG